MRIGAYDKYTTSGFSWLGDIPEHWQLKRLRYVAECLDGRRVPLNSVERASMAGDIPYWGANSVMDCVNKCLFDEELVLLGEDGAPFFEPNKIVAFYSSGPVWPNNHIHVLRTVEKLSAWFLVHVLNITDYSGFVNGSTRDKLTQSAMAEIPIPFPSISEQIAIASFLDQETAKIDALITEQQRLIELLKEKRQAVISHAVTKGLNPDVRMKPSGVEWLGEVPEHWEVRRLKFMSDIQTGDKDTENAVDNGAYPFFVRSQIVEKIDSMSFDCEAVLTAGDGAGVGKVFHYHVGPFDFHQRVYMMNNFRGISGKFLFHYFRENFYKVALEGGAKSTVDSLRRPMLADFWVCVPPMDEQSTIVNEVEGRAEKFDSLIMEAENGVALLQERRQALISAAVTGKIDVRNYASTQQDAA